MAIALADASIRGYYSGKSRGLFWDTVFRDASPIYYMVSWTVWLFATLFAWVATIMIAVSLYKHGIGVLRQEMSQLTMLLQFMSLVVPILLLGWMIWNWSRIGAPLPYLRHLAQMAELRKQIRQLSDNSDTGVEGVTLEDAVEYMSKDWQEDVIKNLKSQSKPRSLSRAISETSDDKS